MSFPIKLQNSSSPTNKVDKSLTDIVTVTGVLRSGVSVTDPIVVVETELTPEMVSQVNYATIEVFHRNYYVTSVRTSNNKLWFVHMHVDVLMTYRELIRQQTAIVSRSATDYNLYLDDGWFMAYQNPRIQTKYFSTERPFESQEFVLYVAGSQ